MKVETQNSAGSFTAQCLITGSSGFTDSAPTNGTSVLPTRYITYPTNIFLTAGTSLTAFLQDGTSATVRFWWYDNVQDLWVPNGTALALTTASTNSGTQIVGAMPGCRFFCQVTVNSGVTKIAFMVR